MSSVIFLMKMTLGIAASVYNNSETAIELRSTVEVLTRCLNRMESRYSSTGRSKRGHRIGFLERPVARKSE